MSEPFLAEVRPVGFSFAPRGWAFCDGQILPINQNQSLYSLLGATYGGDGRTSFALPDMRGRTPIHRTDGYEIGQSGGSETVTLSVGEIPPHTHTVNAISTESDGRAISSTEMLADSNKPFYAESNSSSSPLHAGTISFSGGGASHENMQPYLAINYCIALQGLFPSRN